MQVSLPALKAFESAARLGSFKAAAAELSITPTAVSHHINKLEQRLRVSLFVRTSRKVTLTQSGRDLSEAASEGFQTIDRAIEKIAGKEKQIDVSTTSSFAALVLLPSMQDFYRQFPDITVKISTSERVEESRFALPIRFGETCRQSNKDIIKIEHFNLFGSPNMSKNLRTENKLTIYTTTWKNSALPTVPLLEWMNLNNISDDKLTVRAFDQELFGIQQSLTENGYVFCSTTLANGYVQSGILTALDTKPIESPFCYYISQRETHLSRSNYMFIDWLEKILVSS